ncbi:hypothetical protein SAMN02927924_02837 [Sphingobium faniae]|nr:hypothetical protein SAMN02927924_02837 [Sphingobium faniae]
MTQWRYVTPKTTGRWHPTREAAEDAAIQAGFGHRDSHCQSNGTRGRFYAHPLVRIEEEP